MATDDDVLDRAQTAQRLDEAHQLLDGVRRRRTLGQLELALVEAVYSARQPDEFLPPDPQLVADLVERWRVHRACDPVDNLAHLSALDDHAFARVLDDRTLLHGRPRSCVVQDASDALVRVGVTGSAELLADPDRASAVVAGVRGLGWVTGSHLLTLLGVATAGDRWWGVWQRGCGLDEELATVAQRLRTGMHPGLELAELLAAVVRHQVQRQGEDGEAAEPATPPGPAGSPPPPLPQGAGT